mmetsp:Transcript_121071/g.270287  ORF Transcript_121071/g.270287 Transcript_121071/m.270287 type:complete len:687 (-) Transcript_121071:70-2130(-)
MTGADFRTEGPRSTEGRHLSLLAALGRTPRAKPTFGQSHLRSTSTAGTSQVFALPSLSHSAGGPSCASTWGQRVLADGSFYDGEICRGSMQGYGERTWPSGRRYLGEWRQDMMWGEGELKWPDGGSYAGQFQKGAFHGKGARAWPNGDSYIGDFDTGEQDGLGTFRNAAEGWSFTGQWVHGRMYGQGRVEWKGGFSYIGEWRDSIREGRGKFTWPDGSWYEGPFHNNHIEGHGRKVFADGAWYEGHFADGEFDDHGTFHWPDGTEFEGLWRRSEIVGPGCHRFPSGTAIVGQFEDGGASGQCTKTWPDGCVYTGMLLRNRIDREGTWKWPDGRCYVGQFEDDSLHGQGTLIWYDDAGLCTYKGEFKCNQFDGRGCLQWSNGACFSGELKDGHYHGEGSFTWPGGLSVYTGHWEHGEMRGHGALTCDNSDYNGSADCDDLGDHEFGSYVYVGNFSNGNMEGDGAVSFSLPSGRVDKYKGKFQASRFNGMGAFTWGDGAPLTSLQGLFEDGYVNRVGRKVYPDGHEYIGELRFDLEHGKGLIREIHIDDCGPPGHVAMWKDGVLVRPLLETCAPVLDIAGERKGLLPVMDENGVRVNTKAMVVFLNGDHYVGEMKGGMKHGQGMYVYADMVRHNFKDNYTAAPKVKQLLAPMERRPGSPRASSRGPMVGKDRLQKIILNSMIPDDQAG